MARSFGAESLGADGFAVRGPVSAAPSAGCALVELGGNQLGWSSGPVAIAANFVPKSGGTMTDNLIVTQAEGMTGQVRLGSAYSKKGVYSDTELNFVSMQGFNWYTGSTKIAGMDNLGNASFAGFFEAARLTAANGNGLLLMNDNTYTHGFRIQNLGVDGKARLSNLGSTNGIYFDVVSQPDCLTLQPLNGIGYGSIRGNQADFYTAIFRTALNTPAVELGGSTWRGDSRAVNLINSAGVSWSSNAYLHGGADTGIDRPSASTVRVNDGAGGHGSLIAGQGTYTASLGKIGSNTDRVGIQLAGSGQYADLFLFSGGSTVLDISSGGFHLRDRSTVQTLLVASTSGVSVSNNLTVGGANDGVTGAKLSVATGIYTPGWIWATGGLVLNGSNTIVASDDNQGARLTGSSGLQLVTGGGYIRYDGSSGFKVMQSDGVAYGTIKASKFIATGGTALETPSGWQLIDNGSNSFLLGMGGYTYAQIGKSGNPSYINGTKIGMGQYNMQSSVTGWIDVTTLDTFGFRNGADNGYASVVVDSLRTYNVNGNPYIEAYSNAGIQIMQYGGVLGVGRAGSFQVQSTGYFYVEGRGLLSSSANGILHVQNYDMNESVAQALVLGPGTTATNGTRLKRSTGSSTLEIYNGNGSGYAYADALGVMVQGSQALTQSGSNLVVGAGYASGIKFGPGGAFPVFAGTFNELQVDRMGGVMRLMDSTAGPMILQANTSTLLRVSKSGAADHFKVTDSGADLLYSLNLKEPTNPGYALTMHQTNYNAAQIVASGAGNELQFAAASGYYNFSGTGGSSMKIVMSASQWGFVDYTNNANFLGTSNAFLFEMNGLRQHQFKPGVFELGHSGSNSSHSGRINVPSSGLVELAAGNGSGTWQSGFRVGYDAGGVKCSGWGQTPIARISAPATATDLASVITACNVHTASLTSFGLYY